MLGALTTYSEAKWKGISDVASGWCCGGGDSPASQDTLYLGDCQGEGKGKWDSDFRAWSHLTLGVRKALARGDRGRSGPVLGSGSDTLVRALPEGRPSVSSSQAPHPCIDLNSLGWGLLWMVVTLGEYFLPLPVCDAELGGQGLWKEQRGQWWSHPQGPSHELIGTTCWVSLILRGNLRTCFWEKRKHFHIKFRRTEIWKLYVH